MAITKNKASKPFKVVKPKQTSRRTTVTFKNHRYQSFTERIAKLRIDPVRRRRDHEDREELADERATYFGRALARWRDVNLSPTFVSFANKVAALSDNLPILLHNQEQIMTLLVEHIEKQDALAMEPLLNLTSEFAHDLDVRFEPYFQPMVKTISAVAAKHSDPAVVEWSFNCLAWLFKYLSRLLTPDLRPVYDLMAPYLGRDSQKPYVVRFAAESMSFLVRKAALAFERDPEPLESTIKHILQDLDENQHNPCVDLYQQGIMVLLTDAIKGVQNSMHSAGPAILRTSIQFARSQQSQFRSSVVHGMLTSLIHFSIRDTFAPALAIVLENCVEALHATAGQDALFSAQLLLVVISVRKGSRISDWPGVLNILSTLLETGQASHEWQIDIRIHIASLAAAVLLYCADPLKLTRTGLADLLCKGAWAQQFPMVCDFVARMDATRYARHLSQNFQTYVLTFETIDDNTDDIFLRLPTLLSLGHRVDVSIELQSAMIQHIEAVQETPDEQAEKLLPRISTILRALPYLRITEQSRVSIRETLEHVLVLYLANTTGRSPEYSRLVSGLVLEQWLLLHDATNFDLTLLTGLCSTAESLHAYSPFWSNVLKLITRLDQPSLSQTDTDLLQHAILQALCLSDHTLRQNVLDAAQALYVKTRQDVPTALSTAILIESTPLSLDTSRSISMNIRRLGPEYSAVENDAFLSKAIPQYCLGLLNVRLAQAWDDAIETLGHISKTTIGENAMMETLQQWLFVQPPFDEGVELDSLIDADVPNFQVTSDFECPNLARITALSTQTFEEPHGGRAGINAALKNDLKLVPTIPMLARGQALRVLNKLHHVAEKRSRLIVPTLLQWAGPQSDYAGDHQTTRWNRKDQKAMLNIFSQFQNPRVLFRTAEVHDALLNLCANGDIEIQKAALKALSSWKTPEIIRYEDSLLNILDESRFREELSVFLQGGDEDGLRQSDLLVVMPVLLRLLYGRLVGGSKEGQQAKRKAVFVALSTFPADTMAMFIDIALSNTRDIVFLKDGSFQDSALTDLKMPLRQQLGMLNMFADMVDTLGPALQPFAKTLLNTIIGCTVIATRQLQQEANEVDDSSLVRSVRQNGLQGLAKLFSLVKTTELNSECQVIAHELLHVRLDRFVAENSQSISATLRLISAWSKSSDYAQHLVANGDILLDTVANLMAANTSKTEVQLFVLTQAFDELMVHEAILAQSSIVTHVAGCVASMLKGQIDKALLDACVRTLQKLAGQLQDDETATSILDACRSLLVQPSQTVATKTKVGLLRSMIPLLTSNASLATGTLYEAVCGLFSRLHDLVGRSVLSEVVTKLATSVERQETSDICQHMNKLSTSRLDEPDYQSREQGFVRVYAQAHEWNREQWTPIMHNCLHFLRDDNDTVNRASAAKALHLLISNAARDEALLQLVQNDLFAAIQRGMAQKSEYVRAEYLSLLNSIVLQLKDWKEIADMAPLAFDGDDEASFFTNVLHIQHHRRLRALRRLAEVSTLNSRNIVRIFLPLLEQFIFDQAEGDAGRTLADQAIQTIGQLARRLRWADLRKTLLRYYGYLKTKDDLEKTVLRLIGALVDGLTYSMTKTADQPDQSAVIDDAVVEEHELPQNRINVIVKDYLPPLQLFLHQKDESKVDRRVAVAISIVKLARLLPEEQFVTRLAPTLTDIAHILKSRDLEAREQTRRTLSTILGIVGPIYLRFILKELRGALLKGYQLHVLSYTVHHLLVTNGPDFKPGDIDECLSELTAIILDDIFGVTGQEKDAEEYKSGMKEVKSSKSYDTMEILARMASITSLGQLVLPIRTLLLEKLDSRLVKKIDDLLLRIRRGIDQNPAADSRDMLVLCHELVRQVHLQRVSDGRGAGLEDWKLRKYLTQSRAAPGSAKGATTSYTFKLSAFALALLRKVLRRHEDLQTPANLAGFLPMIGDGLVAGELEVKIESAKLLSTILRVELPEIDSGIPVYLKEAIAMVKGSHSTINDAARAGLELATAILRERRETTIRDRDVAILLRALKADIDEPDRQGQTFRFLRAVLGRKIIIPEVYEVMDDVARIMVNNPDESVRQNARAAYVQFVIDFPQGKERWAKTTAFLVKNLAYEHAGGRKSVLEVVHTLLGRLSADAVQEILLGLFVGLIPRVINDSDSSCREMATVLVQRVLEKADAEQKGKIKALASKWLQSDKKDSIRQAAIACWAILLRSGNTSKKEIDELLNVLSDTLDAETTIDTVSRSKLYISSLELLSALCESNQQRAFAADTSTLWTNVLAAVSSGATDRQELAVKLLALLYNDVASTTAKGGAGLQRTRLVSSAGLVLNADFWCESCFVHLRCLRSTSADQRDLVNNTSKNLVFFGRIFAANRMEWVSKDARQTAEEATEDDDNDDGDSDAGQDADAPRETSALGYLLSRLTYILRREDVSAAIRAVALETTAALIHVLDGDIPNLQLLARPLYVLTDPLIPQSHGEEHKALVDKARETLDLLQSKVGSQKYIEMLAEARKAVGEKRDERRRKRRIEAVSQPERWAKEKRRRGEAKKARSKAKSNQHRSHRRGW